MSSAEEEQFARKVDAQLPYDNAVAVTALIGEARSVSANAVMQIVWEILVPPKSARVSRERQREVLQLVRDAATPELPYPLSCAMNYLKGQRMPAHEALALLRRFREWRGNYNAVNVLVAIIEDAGLSEAERLAELAFASWRESEGR